MKKFLLPILWVFSSISVSFAQCKDFTVDFALADTLNDSLICSPSAVMLYNKSKLPFDEHNPLMILLFRFFGILAMVE